MPADAASFDEPAALATAVGELDPPTLVSFDVDGVLAPIVAHASDAALLPGVLDHLIALAAATPVAIVSGRSIDDLARFGFAASIMVAGSHGAERRGLATPPLSPIERHRLERLQTLADAAAEAAGRGAWVEHKPTGVVLHVREADAAKADRALQQLRQTAGAVAGAQLKAGHAVIELAARPSSKATAVAAMRDEAGAAAVVYVGDDVTDEDVFASLRGGDLGVKVGPGPTAATRRLRDPQAVATYLERLVNATSTRGV